MIIIYIPLVTCTCKMANLTCLVFNPVVILIEIDG